MWLEVTELSSSVKSGRSTRGASDMVRLLVILRVWMYREEVQFLNDMQVVVRVEGCQERKFGCDCVFTGSSSCSCAHVFGFRTHILARHKWRQSLDCTSKQADALQQFAPAGSINSVIHTTAHRISLCRHARLLSAQIDRHASRCFLWCLWCLSCLQRAMELLFHM
jgi:hypothetical protein